MTLVEYLTDPYIMFRPFGFIGHKALNYLAFQSFDFERTWWRLFQKRVVRTKYDIYVFILDNTVCYLAIK